MHTIIEKNDYFYPAWSKSRFALQLLTNGTFFSNLDLFLLYQRKNKINAFQIISRMKVVHSLRWTLSRTLKKYKDLFGFLLSVSLGFPLVVVEAMAKVRGRGELNS